MSKKFTEYGQLNLSDVNKEVLKAWDEKDVFTKSMTEREGCPSFVFYEGPPSANGMPGIHHVMARTIKDVFCRYKTQQGYLVHRKAGWDTHGLPVELGVEKKLGITKEDIGRKISIEEYNAACREAVMEFTGVWENLTRQMGYWVNMDDPYITYDNKYIETLWWLLKQLFDKGLLYKGYTIQPYSPAAGTGLSNHELNQPGCYRDVKDTTCTAQFRILEPKAEMEGWGTPVFLAWTTTPWTLPTNMALAVGPSVRYSVVPAGPNGTPQDDPAARYLLAEDLVGAYAKDLGYDDAEAARAAVTSVHLGKDLRDRIGRASGEAAPADTVQIIAVVTNVGDLIRLHAKLPGQRLQPGQLFRHPLVQVDNAQLPGSALHDPGAPSRDDRRGDAQLGQDVDNAVAVLDMEGLHQLSAVTDVDVSVRQGAVHIHHKQPQVSFHMLLPSVTSRRKCSRWTV